MTNDTANDTDNDTGKETGKETLLDEAAESANQAEGQSPLMPKVTFTTFMMSLASSVLVHLGEVPEPESGEMREDLVMAKHTIDILNMLEKKTRDNRDEAEERLFTTLLYELRMKYVMKTK